MTVDPVTLPQGERTAPDAYADVAGFYDLFAAAQGEAALPRASAFAALAEPGMRVLDIGAGTGRVALAVSERHAHVCCVEPSASMRGGLLAKLAAHPHLWPYVTVVPGQAPDLPVTGSFDYAYLAGSLQFLSAAARRRTFAELAAHLRPGAILALDMVEVEPTPPRVDPTERVVAEVRVGGCRYRLQVAVVEAAADEAVIHYRYLTECDSDSTAYDLWRRRYFHGFAQVRADLMATGFSLRTGPGPAAEAADPATPIIAQRNP